MKKIATVLATLILLTNCKTINETRKSAGISKQPLFLNDKDGIQPNLLWAHYDATQRAGIYLVTQSNDGKVKINVISENPPDAALNSTIDALAKIKVTDKIEAAAKLSAIKSVSELGQRNASNYMIRDIAFRIETLQNNGGLNDMVCELYKVLMKSAENISIAEANSESNKNKSAALQELTKMLAMTKDTAYSKLKLDSTFFQSIQKYIDK